MNQRASSRAARMHLVTLAEVAGVTPEHVRIVFKNGIHELRHGQAKEFMLQTDLAVS